MNKYRKNQLGSILIEAVVAILVLAVGTFGVVKLNSVLLKGGGESKTRAEALQIGQTRIEALMTSGALGSCPTVAGSTTESNVIAGLNANYLVGQDVSNVLTDRFDATVYIAWDGGTNPRNAPTTQKIVMRTVVACGTAGTSGQIGGDATKLNSRKIKTPTGVARVGGRANPTCPTGSCVQVAASTSNMRDDGLKIYKTGNLVELVDPVNNKVLLTIEDGSDYSSISGRVYIQTDNRGNPIVDPQGSNVSDPSDDTVFVLSSDAAYCSRIFPPRPVPWNASGNSKKYVYFDYNCYVSKGWWGNIGIVEVGTRGQDEKVCVGDMAVSALDADLFSRKAALSSTRGYRAFRNNGQANSTNLLDYETVGIGYALNTSTTPNTVSTDYIAVHIGILDSGSDWQRNDSLHHDFLIASINGQGTCEGSGVMTRVSGDTSTSNEFTQNVGKYFCMAQCPPLLPTSSAQTTVVHGTITLAGGTLSGIDSADCQVTPTLTPNGSTYSYSCSKTWTGFAGSSWDGGVTFTSSDGSTICTNSAGSLPVVTPSNLTVASTVNNKTATQNPNSLNFTDVQVGVTDIQIDFDVRATCEKLGTPALRWSATGGGPAESTPGTSMRYISWDAIAYATNYRISSCDLPQNTTSCTPDTVVPNIATPYSDSYYLPSNLPNGSKGRCFSVVATGTGQTDSTVSSTKCVTPTTNRGTTIYTFN